MDLPGAVVDDEISDRDSSEVGSLSSPSPPQVIILQCEHTNGPAQKSRPLVYRHICHISSPSPPQVIIFREDLMYHPIPSLCLCTCTKKERSIIYTGPVIITGCLKTVVNRILRVILHPLLGVGVGFEL